MNFNFFKGSLDIEDFWKSIQFKRKFRKEHPEYFDPDGILVFCGSQGSGKTLSAVSYVIKLAKKYPQMILVTNVDIDPAVLNGIQVYRYVNFYDLSRYSNGYAGVCFLIDEIQLEFNSLESKNIDPAVITEISQQRKQRKHIVGTSQVFARISKPFREQFKFAVMCKCFFGLVQVNRLCSGEDCTVGDDGHVDAQTRKRFIWFHSSKLYQSYNTYAKVLRTNTHDFKLKRKVSNE